MALKRNERYPGHFSNPTTAHPQGAFKNRTAPNSQDGSYLEADWANDWDGFFSSLLSASGLTANGNVDTALNSQYYDALKSLFLQRTNPFGDIKSDGTVNTALANLGLGEAAKSRLLQSGGDSVKDVMSQNAITYLLSLKAGVNGERVEAENFREALNLGNAAQRNVGNTASNNIPDMSFFTSGAGWYKLPNGQIFQFGQSSIVNSTTGVATATFPIAFPTQCDTILITEVTTTGGPTFVKSWGLDTTSITLSSFNGQLNATGIVAKDEFFRFFAMGK